MSDTVKIPVKQLECLLRHYQEGLNMLQGLGVREQEQIKAPKLSKREQRIKHFSELLNAKTTTKKK